MRDTDSTVDLEAAISTVSDRLQAGEELTVRRFSVAITKGHQSAAPDHRPAAILCLRSLVNSETVDRFILQPLLANPVVGQSGLEDAIANRLPTSGLKKTPSLDRALQGLLEGDAVLLIDRADTIFRASVKQVEKRSPDEPKAERIVRGAKQGLIEDLLTNIGLIRSRMRTEALRVTSLKIGRKSHTPIAVCYLEGVANPQVVATVFERLRAIDIDMVANANLVEDFVQDSPWTLFPLVRMSERPDTVCRELANGHVAILVDGTPTALLAPTTFWDLMKTEMDYTYGHWVATLFRVIRFTGLLLGATLPGLYISVVSFHPELIPNRLSLSIAASREGMPFATLTEMGGMLVTFEIFREATLRVPTSIGQTAGVVAGFILGQAAVAAGVISDIMVVVIALSAISIFVIPDFGLAGVVRIISFGSLIVSAFFGLFGLGLWGIVLTTHLAALKSFGVPYLSPFAPVHPGGWLDAIIRAPYLLLRRRPAELGPQDSSRRGPYRRPHPHGLRLDAGPPHSNHESDGEKEG